MYRYDKPDNLVELIERSVSKYSQNKMFGTKDKNGDYQWVTYEQAGERINNLRAGLAKLGVGKNDAVGIIADNRTEWAICAFATYGLGARYIPMYERELPRIWKHIIGDAEVKVLLVATPEIGDQISQMRDDFPRLQHIHVIDGHGENSMANLEKTGSQSPVPPVFPAPQDTAALIYTSGTTGNPKGVLLSHGNFTSNVHAGFNYFSFLNETDRSLSILPWAHSFGQTAELYLFTFLGGSIGFMENVATLGSDMEKLRPTFLISVPKIFNKIYDGLHAKMNETGGLANALFHMGIEAGKQKRQLASQKKTCLFTDLKFKLADKIVFEKIRKKFGGRLKGSLSGSAVMNIEIGNFFTDLGIPVFNCYGLSETSPAITMNCPTGNKPGSVGRPIDQVRVVIDKSFSDPEANEGEVVAYGPNVMRGYHNLPEETKKVFTEDGGLRTGDWGYLDEDGFLFITGRIKEQYKLVNGKYVFPAGLEEELKLLPLVENAMIFGDGRDYNVCLIVPDFSMVEKFAGEQGLPLDRESLAENEKVLEMIKDTITRALKGKFASYEIPKKYICLHEDFSLDNGMLTQTMKLKRNIVLKNYKDRIEALYAS